MLSKRRTSETRCVLCKSSRQAELTVAQDGSVTAKLENGEVVHIEKGH